MANGISVDNLADAINAQLQMYSKLAANDVKECVRSTAKFVRNEIRDNAPERTGDYKDSWQASKENETPSKLSMRVHSKNRYQLTHLLEYGHKDPTGTRQSAKPHPHIKPAEDAGREKFLSDVKKKLS